MLVIGIILALLGLLLLIAFVLSNVRCKKATEATVVKLVDKKQYVRGRTVHLITPVFGYSVDSKEYTVKADFSVSSEKKFYVGKKVTVYLDPKHPEAVRYGHYVGYGLAGLILLALGAFVIVLCFM